MPVTYEKSFTMRGATGITPQPHQIKYCTYNTQNSTPKSKRKLPKTVEASFTLRGRSKHDPSMMREWTGHLAPARLRRLHSAVRRGILYWKLRHVSLRLSTQISPNAAPATKKTLQHHQMLRLPRKVTLQHHQILGLPRKVTVQNHQIATENDTVTSPNACTWREKWLSWLILLRKARCEWCVTRLMWLVSLDWAVNWMSCYLTELFLDWTVTLLNFSWLHCYFTELVLNCYFTELFEKFRSLTSDNIWTVEKQGKEVESEERRSTRE